jgi:metallo-beta-lactamase family protein
MLKLSFFGGAQSVTGANYLLEINPDARSGRATKLLVDCGFFQGSRITEDKNKESFSYNPQEIDGLVITHAHLDHVGRIPLLVNNGFKGKIYSTPATKDLAKLILDDSLHILKKNAKRSSETEQPYQEEDIKKAMALWQPVEYHEEFEVGSFKINLKDAGHILGSSIIEIIAEDPSSPSGRAKIVFSGDLGNPPTPLLKKTEDIFDADYIIVESTYGNRLHEGKEERKLKLERVIEDTVSAGGVLMIPAFSLERTQELLFEINDLVEHGRIPKIPIFLDSPLAIKATDVYRKYDRYYNKKAKYIMDSGDALFKFPGLKATPATEESKAINDIPAPKIILAGSGMSNGGRIIHHEKRYLPDPKSTLLLIGYQSAGSLGRRLQDKSKRVRILGESIPVRAKILTIRGYSAHPDREGLLGFVKNSAHNLKKVFVVQGESRASLFLVQQIRDYLGVNAMAPKTGDSFELKL